MTGALGGRGGVSGSRAACDVGRGRARGQGLGAGVVSPAQAAGGGWRVWVGGATARGRSRSVVGGHVCRWWRRWGRRWCRFCKCWILLITSPSAPLHVASRVHVGSATTVVSRLSGLVVGQGTDGKVQMAKCRWQRDGEGMQTSPYRQKTVL